MAQGRVRRPRGAVKVNGTAVDGWLSWTWDGNSMFQADTFSVAFALSALPADKGPDWWAQQTELEVELLVGFPADLGVFDPSELDSLFVGVVDDASISWERGLLTLNGRDLTARFLDNKTSEKYPNLTSSAIVEQLAGARGMTAVVKSTTTKVGRFYQLDHVRMQDDRTEWELLTYLAHEEGFAVWVEGRELHFGPAPTAATYTITWTPRDAGPPSADFVRVETSRTLTVAKDIQVTVRSWNSKQKQAFTRKATRSRKGAGQVQQYAYTFPGLSPEQAQQKANKLLEELSRHEMRLRVSGPADNTLRKSDVIQLTGTGSAFDQTYYPDNIRRSLDCDGGYAWDIVAKNHSPESGANL